MTVLPQLRFLELFAGSCSLGKVARSMGLKGAHQRAVIPAALCEAVLTAARNQIQHHQYHAPRRA